MRVLVVYESMFGNTALVAKAVADGMAGQVDVRTAEVGTMPGLLDVDAVVVGAPTHAFGMSRLSTRQEAVKRGAPEVRVDVGVREWVDTLDRRGIPAAAFDTIVAKPFLLGSAAGKLAKALRRAGCRLVVPAESFVVTDTAGPLRDGELDRARRWGAEVAKLVAVSQRA